MENIIRMLIEKDLLLVVILGIIIILFLILFVVLILTDKGKKKKQEKNFEEDKIEIMNIQKPSKENEETEKIEDDTLEEKEEKIEQNEENISDIAEVLASMQSYLEERNQKEIDTFEQEQEENAIISYQELVNACKKNKEKEEIVVETKKETKEENKTEPVKKFKNSEFISPIYGKEKKKDDSFEQFLSKNFEKKETSPVQEITSSLETEFSLEEFQQEMKENEEFLEELKNFRNSL